MIDITAADLTFGTINTGQSKSGGGRSQANIVYHVLNSLNIKRILLDRISGVVMILFALLFTVISTWSLLSIFVKFKRIERLDNFELAITSRSLLFQGKIFVRFFYGWIFLANIWFYFNSITCYTVVSVETVDPNKPSTFPGNVLVQSSKVSLINKNIQCGTVTHYFMVVIMNINLLLALMQKYIQILLVSHLPNPRINIIRKLPYEIMSTSIFILALLVKCIVVYVSTSPTLFSSYWIIILTFYIALYCSVLFFKPYYMWHKNVFRINSLLITIGCISIVSVMTTIDLTTRIELIAYLVALLSLIIVHRLFSNRFKGIELHKEASNDTQLVTLIFKALQTYDSYKTLVDDKVELTIETNSIRFEYYNLISMLSKYYRNKIGRKYDFVNKSSGKKLQNKIYRMKSNHPENPDKIMDVGLKQDEFETLGFRKDIDVGRNHELPTGRAKKMVEIGKVKFLVDGALSATSEKVEDASGGAQEVEDVRPNIDELPEEIGGLGPLMKVIDQILQSKILDVVMSSRMGGEFQHQFVSLYVIFYVFYLNRPATATRMLSILEKKLVASNEVSTGSEAISPNKSGGLASLTSTLLKMFDVKGLLLPRLITSESYGSRNRKIPSILLNQLREMIRLSLADILNIPTKRPEIDHNFLNYQYVWIFGRSIEVINNYDNLRSLLANSYYSKKQYFSNILNEGNVAEFSSIYHETKQFVWYHDRIMSHFNLIFEETKLNYTPAVTLYAFYMKYYMYDIWRCNKLLREHMNKKQLNDSISLFNNRQSKSNEMVVIQVSIEKECFQKVQTATTNVEKFLQFKQEEIIGANLGACVPEPVGSRHEYLASPKLITGSLLSNPNILTLPIRRKDGCVCEMDVFIRINHEIRRGLVISAGVIFDIDTSTKDCMIIMDDDGTILEISYPASKIFRRGSNMELYSPEFLNVMQSLLPLQSLILTSGKPNAQFVASNDWLLASYKMFYRLSRGKRFKIVDKSGRTLNMHLSLYMLFIPRIQRCVKMIRMVNIDEESDLENIRKKLNSLTLDAFIAINGFTREDKVVFSILEMVEREEAEADPIGMQDTEVQAPDAQASGSKLGLNRMPTHHPSNKKIPQTKGVMVGYDTIDSDGWKAKKDSDEKEEKDVGDDGNESLELVKRKGSHEVEGIEGAGRKKEEESMGNRESVRGRVDETVKLKANLLHQAAHNELNGSGSSVSNLAVLVFLSFIFILLVVQLLLLLYKYYIRFNFFVQIKDGLDLISGSSGMLMHSTTAVDALDAITYSRLGYFNLNYTNDYLGKDLLELNPIFPYFADDYKDIFDFFSDYFRDVSTLNFPQLINIHSLPSQKTFTFKLPISGLSQNQQVSYASLFQTLQIETTQYVAFTNNLFWKIINQLPSVATLPWNSTSRNTADILMEGLRINRLNQMAQISIQLFYIMSDFMDRISQILISANLYSGLFGIAQYVITIIAIGVIFCMWRFKLHEFLTLLFTVKVTPTLII